MKKLGIVLLIGVCVFVRDRDQVTKPKINRFNKTQEIQYFLKGKKLFKEGKYDIALGCFKKSLELNKNNADTNKYIAFLYIINKKYNKAEEYLLKSISINYRDKKFADVAKDYNSIANIYLLKKQEKVALDYFQLAYMFNKTENNLYEMSVNNIDIGNIYYYDQKRDKAIKYFKQAINNFEEANKNNGLVLKDKNKISYTYDLISSDYFRKDEYPKGFMLIQKSKKISSATGQLGEDFYKDLTTLKEMQKTLAPNQMILIYANCYPDKVIRITVTKENIGTYKISFKKIKEFIDSVSYSNNIKNYLYAINIERAINRKLLGSDNKNNYLMDDYLAALLNYYLYKLEQGATKKEKQRIKEISIKLYEFLFEKLSVENKNIILFPFGVFTHLSFAALRDDRSYLVSKCLSMKYLHNFYRNTKKIINKRDIIAFGGMVYDPKNYDKDMKKFKEMRKRKKVNFDDLFAYLYMDPKNKNKIAIDNQLLAHLKDLKKGDTVYKYLENKLKEFDNLPWTLQTIEDINTKLVKNFGLKNCLFFVGRKATLNQLKSLSKAGRLKEFNIVYLGAHGLVFKGAPNFSGIIFSTTDTTKKIQDIYLGLQEISKLKIEADLVIVSACDSGFVEVNGSSLNSFIGAFFKAGANNVLVSLWGLDEEFTHKFMMEFCRILFEQKQKKVNQLSYEDILRRVKLNAIEGKFGERYRSPMYWAPYVIYSK